MRKALWLLLLVGGCIEYKPNSTLPPAGLSNPRPLEITTQTDKLVQVQVPEVDILWVVDNSCSMFEEQTGISQNNPIFMDFFLGSGLDYHIGVVSTDMNDASQSGKLRQAAGYRWIDEDTANPSNVFGSMIELGTSGSADERGRDANYRAVEVEGQPGGYNEGFIREDAGFHIVTLSDEQDHSDFSRSEFINYVKTLKWAEDMVTYSVIVGLPTSNCNAVVEVGSEYIAVSDAIGGIKWDLCDDNWSEVLEQLGIQASGLRREYFLSELPVEDTVKVWVVESGITYTFEPEIDFTYNPNRNSVVFTEYVPGPLSEVFVEYDVLSAVDEQG